MSDAVDTAIIGAGIVGLATAHALCRDRAGSVALFDRSWPGSGDSGRSFSMVRRHYSNEVVARLAIDGSRTIANWADEVGVADAGFARCGYLLTVPERLVEACRGNVAMLQGIGLDTAFLAPDEIAAVEPELSLEGVAGAAHEPEGGFADAQKMCLGWFAAAASRGLQHHLGTTVRAILVEQGRVTGVETDQGTSPPAAWCWPPAPGRTTCWSRWARACRSSFAACRWRSCARRRAAPLPSAVVSDAVTNVVVRPDRGGSSAPSPTPARTVLARADDCDHGLTPGYLDAVRSGLQQRFPRLSEFSVVRGFAGPYDVTPDWNPVIGPCPGIEGLYLALGWSGHGFKLSPAVGEVVAAEVTGRTPPIDVSQLRAQRFDEGKLLRLAYGPGARS